MTSTEDRISIKSVIAGLVSAKAEKPAEVQHEDATDDDEDDDVEDTPLPTMARMAKGRQSVSAEAYGMWNQKKEFVPPEHAKSEEQREMLRRILLGSFLFRTLEEKDMDIIIKAMKEVIFEAGARIITEGEDGDHLFVIEEGAPVCKKNIAGEEKVVKVCGPGDVFGELALLYNSARAATVDATDRCRCWQLDRETFNHIVKDASSKRNRLHDAFLKNVALFVSLDQYERSQIADALKVETYKKGDYIVKQNEPGDTFYILEEGSLVAMKAMKEGEEPVQVLDYKSGDYFGELALIKNQPRAASVIVTSESAKVLVLDRKSFKKMLGPLEDILCQRSAAYD